MVTCYLRYVIDPYKAAEFEHYGRLWIGLIQKFGGTHHGYFMPSEGANNIALALKYADETRCIVSYERSFFRPVFE